MSEASITSELTHRGEGLVVKRLDAMYQTNSRGADWIKVKPEYVLRRFRHRDSRLITS